MFKLLVTTVKDLRGQAEEFYKLCNRETQLDTNDTLVVAFHEDTLVGIIRLCFEHECYVLRTMQIHPEFQAQGVGMKVLVRFQELLVERGISTAYCMPYTHLESFYGKIGFAKINEFEAPLFLQERYKLHRAKKDHVPAILMKRRYE
jgi:N-acetylglutamate synthase-like GNAT family acetyltransferase